MATIEEITERLRAGLGAEAVLDKSIKLDLKGEGFIHLEAGVVSNEDRAADLTVRISRKDLEALGKGQLNPMTAVITRRMQVSDMNLAMSLQPQIQALFARLS
jgi:putative sterol carrier protein